MVAWFNDDDDDDGILLLNGSKVGVDVAAAVAVVVITGACCDCKDDVVLLLNGSNTASEGAVFGVGKEANEEEACGGFCCVGGFNTVLEVPNASNKGCSCTVLSVPPNESKSTKGAAGAAAAGVRRGRARGAGAAVGAGGCVGGEGAVAEEAEGGWLYCLCS